MNALKMKFLIILFVVVAVVVIESQNVERKTFKLKKHFGKKQKGSLILISKISQLN